MMQRLLKYFGKRVKDNILENSSGLMLLKKIGIFVTIFFSGSFILCILFGLIMSGIIAGIVSMSLGDSVNSMALSDKQPDIPYTTLLSEEISEWLSGDVDINPELSGRLAALAKSYGKKIYISSGYRSIKEQQAIWDQRKKDHPGEPDFITRKWVALPGRSMHQTGMAADVSGYVQELDNEDLKKFGLWKPLNNENWHIEPITTQELRIAEKGVN